jgi:holin-like protein
VSNYLLISAGINTPPALLGIALLFVFLCVYQCVPKPLVYASRILLSHLSLLFIPAIVAVANYTDLIANHALALVLAIVISTLVSLAVVGVLCQHLIKTIELESNSLGQTASDDGSEINPND